jgi:hypothetical protein
MTPTAHGGGGPRLHILGWVAGRVPGDSPARQFRFEHGSTPTKAIIAKLWCV